MPSRLAPVAALILSFAISPPSGAELRGDPAAIADAEAMVEAMGGLVIWRELESVHFVHVWEFWNRPDDYLEHEILDLVGLRSYITMKSEIYNRIRVYSPEHGFWNVVNGEFSYATEESVRALRARAPFHWCRLARAIARGDERYEVRYGPMKDIPDERALVFSGPDGVLGGWILLNTRREPMIWATTEYSYEFGPLKKFGNLRVPDWATTGQGRVRYTMVSLTGSNRPPDPSLFVPPPPHAGEPK